MTKETAWNYMRHGWGWGRTGATQAASLSLAQLHSARWTTKDKTLSQATSAGEEGRGEHRAL